jgi:hypothetical protein
MAKRDEFARPMMGAGASFNTDETGRQLTEKIEQLRARQALANNHLAFGVNAMNLKHRLGDIQADRGNLHLDGSARWTAILPFYGASTPGRRRPQHHFSPVWAAGR